MPAELASSRRKKNWFQQNSDQNDVLIDFTPPQITN